jgi:glycosyltransferase involved in cell wall biosynthesis
MHVLHIHGHPGMLGGSERSLQISISALAALGVTSSVLCGIAPVPASRLAGVEQLVVNPAIFGRPFRGASKNVRGKRALLREVTALKPDVIHIRLNLRPSYVKALAARWPTMYNAAVPICPNDKRFRFAQEEICERPVGLACLTQGHRHDGCGVLSSGRIATRRRFLRRIWRTKRLFRSLASCRYVVASSNWQRDRLITDGLPSDRVIVVAPPIELASPVLIRPGGRPVVAFVGRLVREKGVDHLLRASAAVETTHEVWIIGEGQERSMLEQLAETLGIADRVKFMGGVEPDQLLDKLATATVVVVPSLWPETFNQVGPQAASLGCWVVIYDGGGVRDWTGLYPNVVPIPHGEWRGIASAVDQALRTPAPKPDPGTPHFRPSDNAEELFRLYRLALSRPAA